MKAKANDKPITGSQSTNIGYFYVLLIMVFIIFAAIFLTGGSIPTDPNDPSSGPPTLPPYFGIDDTQDEQRIILPSGALTPNPKTNLQLKTFKVNVCGQTSAIDILVDTSGSMTDENKINKLKDSLRTFTKSFSRTTAVSMQTFSAVVTEKVPWGLYKNNKADVQEAIDGLGASGWTRMRDGFDVAKDNLSEAINQKKYPGYTYNLLLISDGVPEVPPPVNAANYDPSKCWMTNVDAPAGDDRICVVRVCDPITAPALRCFAKKQDPRAAPDDPTNFAQLIKNMKVSIYAIGLYADSSSDNKLRDYLEPLLKDVVSAPVSTHYYAYDSGNNTENLKKIFESIVTKICEEQSL